MIRKRALTEREVLQQLLLNRAVFEPNSGCLLWIDDVNEAGYPIYHSRLFKTSLVHRMVLLLEGVYLPDWLTVDHRCRVRCCINRLHLDVVSRETNSRRVHRRD